MKLLLDQGLPRSAADRLREGGVDAVHVGDLGLAAARDTEIMELARRERMTVVTLDADFHTHLATQNESAPSVIRVRIEGLRGDALAALLLRVVDTCSADLDDGAMVTIDERSVRIKRLPLLTR